MSAKMQFMKKLRSYRPAPPVSGSKSEKDIAAFCESMSLLQEKTERWLEGTGIETETFSATVTDLLVDRKTFNVPAFRLRFHDKTLTFLPVYLYGQGTTGCVEVSGALSPAPLCRLFMRAGHYREWTCSRAGTEADAMRLFDEEAFFDIAGMLLP